MHRASCIVHRASSYILIKKPTRCTNFPNLFLEQNSTCFGQFLYPSSTEHTAIGICHTGYGDCLLANNHHNLLVLLCVHCYTPDDGHRNCPKHVEFYFKNKFGATSLAISTVTTAQLQHGSVPLMRTKYKL